MLTACFEASRSELYAGPEKMVQTDIGIPPEAKLICLRGQAMPAKFPSNAFEKRSPGVKKRVFRNHNRFTVCSGAQAQRSAL